MRLLTFHKILLATALAFFLFFGIRELSRDTGNQLLGIGAIVLCGGLGWYFIWVLRGGYASKKH
jgi:high-affinity Fe2+/Pb2+ permease